MQEVWKIYPENKNYSVSNLGKVKNNTTGRELKIMNNGKGYCIVSIQGHPYKLHRVVGKCFIPNTNNKPQINHLDGNKQNNNVSNLEWVTNSENQKHAHSLGLMKYDYFTDNEITEIKKLSDEFFANLTSKFNKKITPLTLYKLSKK